MFARPPLDYRRWAKIGSPPRPPESVPGCTGPWAPPFCPFFANTGGSRWDCFVAIFVFLCNHTDGLYGSHYFVRQNDWEYFSTGSSTGPHITSTTFQLPPKSHCEASKNRRYSHLSLIPQRSRTY